MPSAGEKRVEVGRHRFDVMAEENAMMLGRVGEHLQIRQSQNTRFGGRHDIDLRLPAL